MIEPELEIAERQRNMQRLLGRCLLRLQQYERTLKALLSESSFSGTIKTVKDVRDERAKALSKTTLGTLVGELVGDLLVKDVPSITDQSEDAEISSKHIDEIHKQHKFSLSMSECEHEALRTNLKDLVDLRNVLVHHLIEKYDIASPTGCTDASDFLETSYQRIDAQMHQLLSWCESFLKTGNTMASFFATPIFKDILVNGIRPDGKVDWPFAGIVRCLRDAEKMRGADAWTRLDDAISLIRREHPEQNPSKYGCKNWRHVLRESGQFDSARRLESDQSRRTWYRSVATD